MVLIRIFILSILLAALPANASGFAEKRIDLEQKLVAAGYSLDDPQISFGLAGVALTGQSAEVVMADPPMSTENYRFWDENGAPQSLEAYAGRPVVLMYWGTWCGACALEMDSLHRLIKDFADDDLKILPVAVRDTVPRIRSYIKRTGRKEMGFAHDPEARGFAALGLMGTPSHVFLNRDHQAVMLVTGPLDWDDEHVRNYLRSF